MCEYDPNCAVVHKEDPTICKIENCEASLSRWSNMLCDGHLDAVQQHIKDIGLALEDFRGLNQDEAAALIDRAETLVGEERT